MVLHPTGLGLKALAFFAVLIAAFYAAPYMNLFFLLLSFLGVMAVLSPLWTWRNLSGVTGEVAAVEPAAAGSSGPITARVRVPGSRARYAVSCLLATEVGQLEVGDWAEVRGDAAHLGELPPLERGLYAIHRATLSTSYPFGFVRVARPIDAPQRFAVYPRPADLGDARHRRDLLAGLNGSHAAVDTEMGPSGVREFRPGDEPRNVHWKATARRGTLAVCEWEGSAGAGIEISLDLRAEAEELEQALSLIAALALWAREHKELLSVASQDHKGTYGEGHAPWRELLVYLAGASARPADGDPPPASSPSVLRLPSEASRRLAT